MACYHDMLSQLCSGPGRSDIIYLFLLRTHLGRARYIIDNESMTEESGTDITK